MGAASDRPPPTAPTHLQSPLPALVRTPLSDRATGVRLGLALVALVAAGCGDDSKRDVVYGPGSLTRLLEVAVEETPADRTVRRLVEHRVEQVPMRMSPLIGESTNGSLITRVRPMTRSEDLEDFLPAFVVRGEGPKSITLPHEFTRGDLTTIVAMISCYGQAMERARAVILDEEMKPVERTEWVEFEQRREPRVLQFDLGEPKSRDAAMGGVKIEFAGLGIHGALVGIELQNNPPAALLPAVGSGASIVAGDESRTAAGLVEGAGWRAEFETAGAPRLHLSVHWPLAVRRGGDRPTLVVSATGAGEPETVRKKLPKAAADGWVDMDIDFASLGAGDARVSIDVEDGDDDRTAAILVGDAVIASPRLDAPTVLLITSDTHRADHLGVAFTREFVDTPALDALADRGVLFTDCQSTTNVTNPSHIAVMTGIHPRDTQIVDNTTGLTSAVPTLAEAFQSAGYRTFAAISTQHLGPRQSGLGQGFDRFESTEEFKRRGEDAIASVARWLDESEGEPVFAWIHIFDAHAPYQPPAKVAARYYDGDPRDKSREIDMGTVEVPYWIKADKITDVEYVKALYRGEVDTIDDALSDLLSRPRVRDGFVAFTSDHGESFGTRGVWWDHAGLYQPNLQVPMILAGPGLPATRAEVPVQQIDVGRTLLDLSGIESEFPGRNIAELALSDPIDEPRFAIAAHGLQASVTSGDWFLVLDLRSYQTPKFEDVLVKGRVQLFDRRSGVDSEEDVLEANLTRAKRMRAALIDWLGEASGASLGSAVELSAQATENLEALGYGGYTERTESVWWSEKDVEPKWLELFYD